MEKRVPSQPRVLREPHSEIRTKTQPPQGCLALSTVFHYPSSRVHFWQQNWRVSKNAPEFTGRQLGPWYRPVNLGSGNRALLCSHLDFLWAGDRSARTLPQSIGAFHWLAASTWLTDEDNGHHVPTPSHRDTAAHHAVRRYSPSIELSQLQQRIVNFHLSPSATLPHPSLIQQLAPTLCVCVEVTYDGGWHRLLVLASVINDQLLPVRDFSSLLADLHSQSSQLRINHCSSFCFLFLYWKVGESKPEMSCTNCVHPNCVLWHENSRCSPPTAHGNIRRFSWFLWDSHVSGENREIPVGISVRDNSDELTTRSCS